MSVSNNYSLPLISPHSFPQAYNIHVNGVLHCRVRYSQLLGLHEQVSL